MRGLVAQKFQILILSSFQIQLISNMIHRTCWEREKVSQRIFSSWPPIQQDEWSWWVIQFPSRPAFGLHGFFLSLAIWSHFTGAMRKNDSVRILCADVQQERGREGGGGGNKTRVVNYSFYGTMRFDLGVSPAGPIGTRAANRFAQTVCAPHDVEEWEEGGRSGRNN